ncbi:MAG: hypothetical protein PSV35_08620, partial [bacterium]|nr:hypothetical protein [bacterium]
TTCSPNLLFQESTQRIKQWHKLIEASLRQKSNAVQQWYFTMFKAIVLNHDLSCIYKKEHLIKDFLFILEQKNDNTLAAYMHLCPNPDKDLKLLLSYKPNTPVSLNPEINCSFLQKSDQFSSLYSNYLKFKATHPLEAQLLIKAINILYNTKILNEATTFNPIKMKHDVPNFMQDPLFKPLKRHRGFLRIWQFLEDLLSVVQTNILGWSLLEYGNKTCFFKTRTQQLIEDTELSLQNIKTLEKY